MSGQCEFKQVNLPPLLALKLVDRPQDVTQGTPCLKIQETLGLNTQKQQWGYDVSAIFTRGLTEQQNVSVLYLQVAL